MQNTEKEYIRMSRVKNWGIGFVIAALLIAIIIPHTFAEEQSHLYQGYTYEPLEETEYLGAMEDMEDEHTLDEDTLESADDLEANELDVAIIQDPRFDEEGFRAFLEEGVEVGQVIDIRAGSFNPNGDGFFNLSFVDEYGYPKYQPEYFVDIELLADYSAEGITLTVESITFTQAGTFHFYLFGWWEIWDDDILTGSEELEFGPFTVEVTDIQVEEPFDVGAFRVLLSHGLLVGQVVDLDLFNTAKGHLTLDFLGNVCPELSFVEVIQDNDGSAISMSFTEGGTFQFTLELRDREDMRGAAPILGPFTVDVTEFPDLGINWIRFNPEEATVQVGQSIDILVQLDPNGWNDISPASSRSRNEQDQDEVIIEITTYPYNDVVSVQELEVVDWDLNTVHYEAPTLGVFRIQGLRVGTTELRAQLVLIHDQARFEFPITNTATIHVVESVTTNPSDGSGQGNANGVTTGDTVNMSLYLVTFILSLAALGTVMLVIKKTKRC